MSTLLYGPNQTRLNFGSGNRFLAHLQAATGRRFTDGRGYYLTLAGTNDDGQNVNVSWWMHPSIPLGFVYDAEDETGEPPEPVEIEDDFVDILLEAMDRSLGVLWGFFDDQNNTRRPFVTQTDRPPVGDTEDKNE